MSNSTAAEGDHPQPADADGATAYRIRFRDGSGDGSAVMMAFADPNQRYAERTVIDRDAGPPAADSVDGEFIDVLTVPRDPQSDSHQQAVELSDWVGSASAGEPPPLIVMIHGAHIVWRPGRAAIMALPERLETVLTALVDFCHFECELRKLEQEVGSRWREFDRDSSLACEVTSADLPRADGAQARMKQTLERRVRYVRIAPALQTAGRHLPRLSQQVGNRLREKTRIEDRLEALNSQLEVAEFVYEMTSQRLSEFRQSLKERRLEWIIILLLAVEVALMLMTFR